MTRGQPGDMSDSFDHHSALVALYRKRDPSKLDWVNEFLQKYAGQEVKLWVTLGKKYGLDAQPPPGFRESEQVQVQNQPEP